MTMSEAKSIETTLIKISVRSLWYLIGALLLGSGYAFTLYSDLKDTNTQIINRLERMEQATQYRIETNEKDIARIDVRVTKLENK